MTRNTIHLATSVGISLLIAFVGKIGYNHNLNGQIETIENDSKDLKHETDSLSRRILESTKNRYYLLSNLNIEESKWTDLEYTNTFQNSRASVYNRMDQEFVEKCKTLGLKNSTVFYDFIQGNSFESDSIRQSLIDINKKSIKANSIQINELNERRLETKFIVILTLVLTGFFWFLNSKKANKSK